MYGHGCCRHFVGQQNVIIFITFYEIFLNSLSVIRHAVDAKLLTNSQNRLEAYLFIYYYYV